MRSNKTLAKSTPYQIESPFNLVQDMFDLSICMRKSSNVSDLENFNPPAVILPIPYLMKQTNLTKPCFNTT
jgi:hypothetical protein